MNIENVKIHSFTCPLHRLAVDIDYRKLLISIPRGNGCIEKFYFTSSGGSIITGLFNVDPLIQHTPFEEQIKIIKNSYTARKYRALWMSYIYSFYILN